ncbi:hypothetical protein Droror1_Dr00021667, partial [Drosera rotundifolia]
MQNGNPRHEPTIKISLPLCLSVPRSLTDSVTARARGIGGVLMDLQEIELGKIYGVLRDVFVREDVVRDWVCLIAG